MIAPTGIVLVSALLACAPAWARPSPAGRALASAGQAGPAAIGAAGGARTAVEQASQGTQAPAGRGAQAPARGAQPPPAPGATGAQTPAPAAPQAPPSPAAPATAGQAPAPTPLEPAGFTYNPEGRRDPFVSLVRRGTTTTRGGVGAAAARPAGLAGLETAEVTLRGIIRSREGFVAMLQGADQKTYIVRAGDKLFDGTVRTISQNDMVILQQVNDPLSLEKQREVRKVLRTVEAN